MTAVENFDPYSQWLGLPGGREPADYYELLGLRRFESDLDLIAHTADTLRARLRKVRPGPHLADWQRLLDQLQAAKNSLAEPISKAAYDESLEDAARQQNEADGPMAATAHDGPAHTDNASTADRVTTPLTGEPNVAWQQVEPQESQPTPIEAPPVVGATHPASTEPQTDEPAVAVRKARNKRRPAARTNWALRILLLAMVLMAVAVGLAVLKSQQLEEQAARTWRKPPAAEPPPVESPPPEEVPAQPPASPKPPVPSEPTEPQEPVPPEPPAVPIPRPESGAPATPPQIDPAQTAAFREAADQVRHALSMRELAQASESLTQLPSLAQTPEDRAEADRLAVLRDHVVAFWESLQPLVESLGSGSELQVAGAMVVVVETGPNTLIVRSAGRNRRYSVDGLPHEMAAATAAQLFTKSSNARALRAAFLIVERNSDLQQARQLLQEAAQGGAAVSELLEELDYRSNQPN